MASDHLSGHGTGADRTPKSQTSDLRTGESCLAGAIPRLFRSSLGHVQQEDAQGSERSGSAAPAAPPGSAPHLARQPPLEAAAVARRSRLLPRSPQLLGMRRTEGEQSNPRGETPRLLVCAVPAGTPIIPVKRAKRSAASALAQHRAQLSPAAAHGWERCLPGKSYSQHSYFWELLLLDTKHLAATEHHTTGAFFPSPPPLLWLLWKN